MNKIVEAMKQHWDEYGISVILANKRTIAAEVNSLYLKTTASDKEQEQYNQGVISFSMKDRQELAKHVIAKIEDLIEKKLPAHINDELTDLLANNKDIPDIFDIAKMADDYNKLSEINLRITNYNNDTIHMKFLDNLIYIDLCNVLLNKIDKLIQERTNTTLVSGYKTYLKYLAEDRQQIPSYAEIEKMNKELMGGI